jgi:hypothetical protein
MVAALGLTPALLQGLQGSVRIALQRRWSMARYRWDSPLEWLTERADTWDAKILYQELLSLADRTDSDVLHDQYANMMDEDGYFTDMTRNNVLAAKLSREQCVAVLKGISIVCYEHEPVETLRTIIVANLDDDTLSYDDVVAEVVNG